MTLEQADPRAKLRREKAKEAIALAMESRWEEAVSINRAILELFPDDGEAYNRLGKALFELGDYGKARAAFSQALQLSPGNIIARKNLERLALLDRDQPTPVKGRKLTPQEFLGESGKTGLVVLEHSPPPATLARMTPGDPVQLRIVDGRLVVENAQGEYLGQVGLRVARRLLRLIQDGNRYEGAVARVNEAQITVILRETYQHPDLRGIVSFPSRGVEQARSYPWTGLAELEPEEVDEGPDVAPRGEWEEERGHSKPGRGLRRPGTFPEPALEEEGEDEG